MVTLLGPGSLLSVSDGVSLSCSPLITTLPLSSRCSFLSKELKGRHSLIWKKLMHTGEKASKRMSLHYLVLWSSYLYCSILLHSLIWHHLCWSRSISLSPAPRKWLLFLSFLFRMLVISAELYKWRRWSCSFSPTLCQPFRCPYFLIWKSCSMHMSHMVFFGRGEGLSEAWKARKLLREDCTMKDRTLFM